MDATLPLFTWAETRPIASPSAPPGVQRAARTGGRVDPAVLKVAARIVGIETPHAEFWAMVNAITQCAPDTPRRRLDALADQGLVRLGASTKLNHVLVLGVG